MQIIIIIVPIIVIHKGLMQYMIKIFIIKKLIKILKFLLDFDHLIKQNKFLFNKYKNLIFLFIFIGINIKWIRM